MKWKVGMRVRIIGDGFSGMPIGTTGVIYDIDNTDDTLWVHWDDPCRPHWEESRFVAPETTGEF